MGTVSVIQDEKILEICCTTYVYIVNNTVNVHLKTLKRVNLCIVGLF